MQYLLDSHTHTIASGHAYNTIDEMARAAAEKGLSLLGITEHTMAMPGTCGEIYFRNLKVLPREMYGVKMLFGAEVNIMDADGALDMDQALLEQMDVVVASLHDPCIAPAGRGENTRAILNVMKNPAVHIIGHPDNGRYPLDYEAVVKVAKENHVLLELNNSSLRPDGGRPNARENELAMLKLCKRYRAEVIMDSDAHCAADVGNHAFTDEILREADFPDDLLVNTSLKAYMAFLRR